MRKPLKVFLVTRPTLLTVILFAEKLSTLRNFRLWYRNSVLCKTSCFYAFKIAP